MTHDPPCSHTCHLIWPWIPALLELGFFCPRCLRNSCPNYQGNSSCYLVLGDVVLQIRSSFGHLRRSRPGLSAKGDMWRLHRCSGHQSWHKLGGLKQDVWDLARHPFHLGSFPNFFRWKNRLEIRFPTQEFPVFFINEGLSYRIPY